MSEIIKNVCVYLVIGAASHSISIWLQSSFLEDFLTENLITLLFALLAINTTTISVIMTKLREITEENKVDFSRSVKAMKRSVIEQLVLIVIASICLVVKESQIVAGAWTSSSFVLNVVLVAVFAYSVHVLYDTANGIFVILKHENKTG